MDENGELNVQKVIREIVEKAGPALARKWGEELRADRAKVREATDQAEVDTEVITKKCTKCGEVKALDAYYAQKTGKHGRKAICKKCDILNRSKYRQEVREYGTKYERKCRKRDEKVSVIKARSSKKCSKCREEKSLDSFYSSRRYIDGKNPQCKDCAKLYQQKKYSIEYRRSYQKEYVQNNKERISEQKRAWRKKNAQKIAEYNHNYHKHNPERNRRSSRKRRALKRFLPHQPLTPQQYEILHRQKYEIFGGNASGN